MYRTLINGLRDAWSATGFGADQVSLYAERVALRDARQGLMMLSTLLLAAFSAEIGFFARFGFGQIYIYTCSLLALLCVHVAVFSRVVKDTRSVYMLGATLLMISGTAFVLLAHQAGGMTLALFASVTLLFMAIPLVPWGLREGLLVAGLIYFTFTVSTWSAPSGFDAQALWSLQFIMVGAGLTSLTLVLRNARVRKADIRARFDLERAHHRLLQLSNRDPLTGAFNRRYLKEHFADRLADWHAAGQSAYFALLDLDNFKPINDTCGHDYGDQVLCCVARTFTEVVGDHGCLVRMGGDEFALLFASTEPERLIAMGLDMARARIPAPEGFPDLKLEMSIGLVSIPVGAGVTQEAVYREADTALYQAKDRKKDFPGTLNLVQRSAGVSLAAAPEAAPPAAAAAGTA